MILYIGDWFTVLAMFILAGEASDNSPLAIAGNSVHHDMRFIRREMPMVSDYCTFRIIDISSFKELLKRISPNGPRFYKRSDHTALADARGSLEELRFYVKNYMNTDSD